MIALRAQPQAFVYGDYKDLDPDKPNPSSPTPAPWAPRSTCRPQLQLRSRHLHSPASLKVGSLVMSNLDTTELNTGTLNLAGWEARIYKLQ